MIKYNGKNISLARNMRKNMTSQERKLWYNFLRNYPVKVYRQKPVGEYIVDFYCDKASLVIELDGGGHYTREQQKKDMQRTQALEDMGLSVIRIVNTDVDRNFPGVCEYIDRIIKGRLGG